MRRSPGFAMRSLSMLVHAMTLCLGLLSYTTALAEPAPEDVVKAAVIFKLTKFVSWPDAQFTSESSALRICSIGDTRVADALRVVEGRISQGRPIAFKEVETLTEEDHCHLLFVGEYKSPRSARAAEQAETMSVLTVSDGTGFARNGGVVELTRRGSRLGFRINVGNARRANLVISAPLLELAEIVE